MSKSISGIVTWLKDWFYEKNQVDNLLSNKVDIVSGKGLSTNDYTTAEKNKLSGLSNYTHPPTHSTDMIEIPFSFGSFFDYEEGTSQTIINADIDVALYNLREKINTLESKELLTVVQSLPTASSNTMNKLYMISKSAESNNNYDIYVTVKKDNQYNWEKVDDANISIIDWSNIGNKPISFPPSNHNHYVSEIEISITGTGQSARPGTLDEYLDILETRIDNISVTGEMAEILTHINQYYGAYE